MIATLNKLTGFVVSAKANFFEVLINNLDNPHLNGKRLLCTSRNNLKYRGFSVNVGDYVLVESIDSKVNRGVISKVNPRKSLLERPAISNLSDIFIVLSLVEPKFDPDQASRFLLTAEKTNVNVSLILNKSDLIDKNELSLLKNFINDWGYETYIISLKKRFGLEKLINKVHSSHISVLCGPSGVGKSSLINLLIPGQKITTSGVSKKIRRGKNTTRNIELFSLSNNSYIADTPGFNRPEINIKPNDLPSLFPEIRSQLKNKTCKFRDCLHLVEPDCALTKDWSRYSFYKECLEEMIKVHHLSQVD